MANKQPAQDEFLKPARECVCFHLRRSARVVSQMYDDALRSVNLRVGQFSLLVGIHAMAPVTVQALAKVMGMDRTTLTRNLRPLHRQGMLKIYPGQDRRERTVEITAEGRKRLEKAMPLWDGVQGQMKKQVGGDALVGVLKDFSKRIERI